MPTATKYAYTAADFSGGFNLDNYLTELAASSIVTAPDLVQTKVVGGAPDLWFKDQLSAADKTTLDGGATQTEEHPPLAGSLLKDHDGSATPAEDPPITLVAALDTNVQDAVTGKLDTRRTSLVILHIKGTTGAHTTHVVQLQCSVDGATWFDMAGETVTGEGIKMASNVAAQFLRAKVTTPEGATSTSEVTLQAK